MGQYKLTTFSKVLILILILILIGGGIFAGISKGFIKTKNGNNGSKIFGNQSNEIETDADGNVINTDKTSEDTINLSLDEWIG